MAKRIVIVEDDPGIRNVYEELIRSEGYSCWAATNGREALDLLNNNPGGEPCLVLTDMMMPHMDGNELIRALKSHDQFMTIPVIMVSASAEKRDVPEGVLFFRKPIAIDTVMDKVKEFCGPPNEECPTPQEKVKQVKETSIK